MVVFIDGKPDKKEYRKYKIRTVQGPDDYETMREVIRRRYERVLKEGLELPDLIVIDGGKGQIGAARGRARERARAVHSGLRAWPRTSSTGRRSCWPAIRRRSFRCRVTARNFICCSASRRRCTGSRSPSIGRTRSEVDDRFHSWTPFRASARSGASGCCSISAR